MTHGPDDDTASLPSEGPSTNAQGRRRTALRASSGGLPNDPLLNQRRTPAHSRLGVCGAMIWVVLHAPVGSPMCVAISGRLLAHTRPRQALDWMTPSDKLAEAVQRPPEVAADIGGPDAVSGFSGSCWGDARLISGKRSGTMWIMESQIHNVAVQAGGFLMSPLVWATMAASFLALMTGLAGRVVVFVEDVRTSRIRGSFEPRHRTASRHSPDGDSRPRVPLMGWALSAATAPSSWFALRVPLANAASRRTRNRNGSALVQRY